MKTTPAVGAHHSFKIQLIDVDGKPLKNVPCDVDTNKETIYEGITTDDSGVLSLTVPAKKPLVLTVHLFPEELTMYLEVETFGGADTVAGARARLNNLGYIALTDSARVAEPEDDLLDRGLDRFRFANGLVDKGGLPAGPMRAPFDAETKARLEDAHDKIGSPLMKEP
jgi:hypothetical protein